MFRLQLFKIRAFTAGVFASFLGALGRGGLMFMLIIWLQGIWLPRHGYAFDVTPLWAGIFIIPLTAGFLIAGPALGHPLGPLRPAALRDLRHDRHGRLLRSSSNRCPSTSPTARSGCCSSSSASCMASFGSSNRTGVMNSLPAPDRGAGSGMNTTFQNSAQVLSIGIFFTLIIVGPVRPPAGSVGQGLTAHGVPAAHRRSISHLPPVSTLFAAFLGYNPASHLLGPHVLVAADPGPARHRDGRTVLPDPDHRLVPRRAARRVRLRHRHVPGRGGGLVDPGRQGADRDGRELRSRSRTWCPSRRDLNRRPAPAPTARGAVRPPPSRRSAG